MNYTANCTLVGLSTAMAASQLFHPDTLAAWPSLVSLLSTAAQKGAELYNYIIDVHPIATKVSFAMYEHHDTDILQRDHSIELYSWIFSPKSKEQRS